MKSDHFSTLYLLKGAIWMSVASATLSVLKTLTPNSQQDDYMFAKRMVQVVSTLAQQLFTVWTSEEGRALEKPENFEEFLPFLLNLMQHQSLLISGHALAAWRQIFNNSVARNVPSVVALIPDWMTYALTKVCVC